MVRRPGRRAWRWLAVVAVVAALTAGVVRTVTWHQPATPIHDAVRLGHPVDIPALIRKATLVDYETDGHGSLLSQWELCDTQQRCRYFYRITGPGEGNAVAISGAGASFVPARPGFVQLTTPGTHRSLLFRDHGTTLVTPTANGVLGPSTVLGGRQGVLMAVNPDQGVAWSVPAHGCTADIQGWGTATISSSLVLWAMPAQTGPGLARLCESTDGVHWRVAIPSLVPRRQALAAPGPIATAGDRVAAVAGQDGANVLAAAGLWTNAGGWHRLSGLPFTQVDSMAATSDGVLFVATPSGALWRSTDWTTFTKVTAPPLYWLRPDGRLATGQDGNGPHPRVYTVAADGHTTPWPQSLR